MTDKRPNFAKVNTGPLVALVLAYALFLVLVPQTFGTFRNVELIVRQTVIVGLAALGMTLLIVAGEIDLSVGAIIAICTVAMAWLLNHGFNPALATAGGIGVGLACGLLNGVVVARLRLPAFIVTLGSMQVIRGLALHITGEQKLDPPSSPAVRGMSDWLATLPAEQRWQVFPPGVWLLLLLALTLWFVLTYHRFGKHVVSVGSNAHTSKLVGIAGERVQTMVFAISGIFAGIAGAMEFSYLGCGDPTVADGTELDAIAAVVIGGGSLSGGKGSVPGTILGALLMTTVRAGCTQMGWSSSIYKIVTGMIIVLAVYIDRWRRERGE